MIGDAPRSSITGVPGWESPDEQAYLLQLATNVPAKGQIVEIGAEYGMSSSLFCKGAKDSVNIVSVDLFPGELLSKHMSNLAEAGFAGRSSQIQANSAYYNWTDGPIDLLFIDGDHSYEGCKTDIEKWVPFVKVGGIVAFHDCANAANLNPHYMHFYVTRAVSEWYWAAGGDWKALVPVNTLLSFERVK